MRVDQQKNRTTLTASKSDLDNFSGMVKQARGLPVYAGSIDVCQIRDSGSKFADGPLSYKVPSGMDREWVDAGGVKACWFRRTELQNDAPVLYLHGGGYCGGSVEASRGIAAQLADALKAPVLAVEYRQGPEDPYPAAVQDTQMAYRWLLEQTPEKVTLVGDSAGGALAVGMAVDAARSGLRAARCAIAMSGWIDFSLTGYSWQANRDMDLVSVPLGQFFVDSYLAKTAPVTASSFFFDRLEMAPPLLIQMGSIEGPLDSTVAFAERARALGVSVDLEVYTDMPHNFTKFCSPICDESYRRIGLWSLTL